MTTTKAATKRAERERRRAAGYKRVEVWLSAEDFAWAKEMAEGNEDPVSEIVRWSVECCRLGDQ